MGADAGGRERAHVCVRGQRSSRGLRRDQRRRRLDPSAELSQDIRLSQAYNRHRGVSVFGDKVYFGTPTPILLP